MFEKFGFLVYLLFTLFFATSSAECQTSDWSSGHKLKCKVFRITDSSSPVERGDIDFKASLFGNRSASKVALVPQLSQRKASVKPGDVMYLLLSHLMLTKKVLIVQV